ncbi:MAG: DegT/DnrJ/EryC1/StrS family aminotransferase [Deinococcota bacterium]
MFRVPRSRVHETHQALRDEILAALEPLLFGPVSGEGAEVRRRLEAQFCQVVEQRCASAVHSGTMAMFIALRACGVGPGDEVITVANSDISTTGAISFCGAVPVLCDILETDYTMNPERVEPLISERTVALLAVDLHGHPADVKRLRELADKHGLKIVEDAALATGAKDYGYPVGAFADACVFSFAPLKPIGCVGSGGMVTTNDEAIAERLNNLAGYGHSPEKHPTPGYQNYVAEGYHIPLDPLQAALVSIKLPYLDAWTEKRRSIVKAYAEGLKGSSATLPRFREVSQPTFRSYTIRVPDQQRVYQALRAAGIEVVLHYAPPIYDYSVYKNGLPGAESLPITDQVAKELLSLPVTVELTDEDVQYVLEVLRTHLS